MNISISIRLIFINNPNEVLFSTVMVNKGQLKKQSISLSPPTQKIRITMPSDTLIIQLISISYHF